MKVMVNQSDVMLWLSANDTYQWATRPGAVWPCSQLSGHRLWALFDSNGLADYTVDGEQGDYDGTEFSAICADFLKTRLPEKHPAFFVAVGQFDSHASVTPA